VIAALSSWHDRHEDAAVALADVSVLPEHVLIEAYSVLTRMPGGRAVPAKTAAEVLLQRFDQPPLRLDARARRGLVKALATAGVGGGSAYDGLIALEAAAHGGVLLTLDERAQRTYDRLGVVYRSV
jgi:toxin FitB